MKKIERRIFVIGINSFKYENLSLEVQKLFHTVRDIAVPKTYLNEIMEWAKKEFVGEKNFYKSESNIDLINWLKLIDKDVILVSRGDPLWYGIGRILINNFSREELIFYPGNTSLQLVFSKLKRSWQNIK